MEAKGMPEMSAYRADKILTIHKETVDKDSLKVEILKPRDFSEPCVLKFTFDTIEEDE